MMLKTLTLSTLLLMSSGALAQNQETMTQDEAAIASIVESVGNFADRGEFDALSRLYADQFTLDYSSLNGQAQSDRTPFELMMEWSSVLPGFDRTRHALSDIEVGVNGSQATARANVEASHWVEELFWQVVGHYDYEFSRISGQWKITSMTFNLEGESGTRDVFALAASAASKKVLPGHKVAIAERNKQSVERFFRTLERENIDEFIDMFAEDGIQLNPYNAGIFPAEAKGRSELKAYWGPVPGNFDGMEFHIDELLATEDPNIVFVRYRGEIKLKNNGGVYKNTYYSTFRFNTEGKITEYVEVFDPIVAARGFGLIDKLK